MKSIKNSEIKNMIRTIEGMLSTLNRHYEELSEGRKADMIHGISAMISILNNLSDEVFFSYRLNEDNDFELAENKYS